MAFKTFARSALALVAAMILAPSVMAAETGEMSLGNPQAKVTVIEYASVTCPHCGRFNNDVFPAFKAKYIDTGKIHYVFRELPINIQADEAGYLVARCAGKDKYFAVVDALFHGQNKLFASGDGKTWLLDAGKVGGLNEAQLQACLNDKAAQDAFGQRVQAAMEKDKIQSTPTFIIGDRKIEGEQTLDQLSAVIDPMLAAK